MNKQHMALSLSVGVLGGVSMMLAGAWNVYEIWIGFIAWGLFFKNGGDNNALKMTITAGSYGAVVAGLFFFLSSNIDLGALNGPLWIAITVFALMMGTQVAMFSCAPTAVCGYAATAGYILLTAGGQMAQSVTTVGMSNPIVMVIITIIIGSAFGMLSGKVSSAIGG